MWLVRPTVDVDLQSAVLGVAVSWFGGKPQFGCGMRRCRLWLRRKLQLGVGVERQVLGTEQNGGGFPRL